ncbi:plasmid replication initiation protein, partial [Klebsiella pneumoniae]
MNLAMFSAVFCCFVIRGLRASVLSVGMFSFPLLAHSVAMLLPFGCGERQEHACKKLEKTERSRSGEKERPQSGRFSIGSAP